MRVVLTAAANEEPESARDWYERERAGLGGELFTETVRVLAMVAEHPLRYRVVRHHLRRALMQRFPYAIYYRVHANTVVEAFPPRQPRSSGLDCSRPVDRSPTIGPSGSGISPRGGRNPRTGQVLPACFLAVTSISMRMRGSASPAWNIVAAGRIVPKRWRSTGQQAGKSAAFGRM